MCKETFLSATSEERGFVFVLDLRMHSHRPRRRFLSIAAGTMRLAYRTTLISNLIGEDALEIGLKPSISTFYD